VAFGCGDQSPRDVDGTYRAWFADHGVVAALQRPDFSLFGTATRAADEPELVRSLQAALRYA